MAAAPQTGSIPGIEGLTGVARKEAVFKAAFNEEFFNRDAVRYEEEGSRENPIAILSHEAERYVGLSLPDDNEVRWFILKKGAWDGGGGVDAPRSHTWAPTHTHHHPSNPTGYLAFDPDTNNFLALRVVTEEETESWVHVAENTVFGGTGH